MLLSLVSCKKKEETVLDEYIPLIHLKEDVLYLDDLDYDFVSNCEVAFGELGGDITSELKYVDGEYKVVLTAKGSNGLISTTEFKVVYEPTKGKSAIVFGDSIVYGIYSNGYSFANYLNDDYDFDVVVNAGYSDYRLSTYDDENKWLVDSVRLHYDDEYEYDFVLLEGGVNDVIYETPVGEISDAKNIDSFDRDTFIGGLEAYLYTVTSRWPNAKIGYIITYYTKDYSERGLTYAYETYKDYYDNIKLVLNKWNIEYLDLFDDEFSEILMVDTNKYLPDKLHLNRAGHELITPYIYEWMRDLKRYDN